MKLIAAALLTAGIVVGAGAAFAGDGHDGPVRFDIYDHPDVYWVFQHTDEICNLAANTVATGRDFAAVSDDIVEWLPAEAKSEDSAMYVRGLLAGCLD